MEQSSDSEQSRVLPLDCGFQTATSFSCARTVPTLPRTAEDSKTNQSWGFAAKCHPFQSVSEPIQPVDAATEDSNRRKSASPAARNPGSAESARKAAWEPHRDWVYRGSCAVAWPCLPYRPSAAWVFVRYDVMKPSGLLSNTALLPRLQKWCALPRAPRRRQRGLVQRHPTDRIPSPCGRSCGHLGVAPLPVEHFAVEHLARVWPEQSRERMQARYGR